jgi:hypothetical protein
VFKQPTLSVVFRSFFYGSSVIVLVLQTVKMSSSSSNVPNVKKGRGGHGGVPPPSLFPKVVYPVGAGSPVGIQPPVANTIQQSFDKQRVAINKAAVKAGLHVDTKTASFNSWLLRLIIKIRYVSCLLISLLRCTIMIWFIKHCNC